MKNLKFITAALFAALMILLPACSDDGDPAPVPKKEDPDVNTVPLEVQEINGFIYENMKAYYFWESNIPELDYKKEEDSKALFDKCVYEDVDRWSFITDDYQGLLDMLSGVSLSNGYEFRLYYRDENTSNEVVGFIEYVEPNSPADVAGLTRGDMFYKVDDVIITDQNYGQLVFNDNLKLTLGTLNADRSVTERTPSLTMQAAVLQSNPILHAEVIAYEGHKIGYLVYTSFLDEYNDQLEAVFADFKAQGIDNLVIDLRYNSGGAVSSAILMSSMIAPAASVGDVLLRTAYNPALTNYLNGEFGEGFNIDRIVSNDNNLDLSKVYVLTTYKSASASEMVIYGLEPHMEVVQIGEKTHGKYYGSITIDDQDNHNWAMQPIVMRAENANNSIDYTDGLLPDIVKKDFVVAFQGQEIYPFGDVREDFLAEALTQITGVSPLEATLKSGVEIDGKPLNVEANFVSPLKYDMQYDFSKK